MHIPDTDPPSPSISRRNPRASVLSFNSLLAMSALLCCGPVFRPMELERESHIYRWLENMLSSAEPKVGGYCYNITIT